MNNANDERTASLGFADPLGPIGGELGASSPSVTWRAGSYAAVAVFEGFQGVPVSKNRFGVCCFYP